VESVTVLEFGDTLKADQVLQAKARSMKNVEIITNALTTEVRGDGQKAVGLNYTDRTSGESKQLDVAGIFVQIGLVPNTEWLKNSDVDLSRFGEIEIDNRGATNLPGVFAAGDATTVPYKQIIIAMGAGSTAALSAFDHLIRTPSPEERKKEAAAAD
jgi:alkyl hydroperoxide reductase subunit F